MKLHFDNDYMRGALPEVMERLVATNLMQTVGYGYDEFTKRAKELILSACGLTDGEVVFLVGGTQTNSTVIDITLGRYEGVIAAETAHINVHEGGAVEASGHKVITLPEHDGKIDPAELAEYLISFYADESWRHMVKPGMVYISYPTELGTVYSRSELETLRDICHRYDMLLYIDGARLAYGLAAQPDVTLKDIASIVDIFYIGGTKAGTLFGEAVVTRRPELLHETQAHIKAHGALLAKGRLLGLQFETLFTDGLYEKAGRRGVETARKLADGFVMHGFKKFIDSPTNQQFIILPNEVLDRLRENVTFELWGPRGEHETPVRFVTDWGTTDAEIDTLISLL